jgi:rubrerythrin
VLDERGIVDATPTEAVGAPAVAPAAAPREYRCTGCGYGAILRPALPICPMCGGTRWKERLHARSAGPFAS